MLGSVGDCPGLVRSAGVCFGLLGLLGSVEVCWGLQESAGVSRGLLRYGV